MDGFINKSKQAARENLGSVPSKITGSSPSRLDSIKMLFFSRTMLSQHGRPINNTGAIYHLLERNNGNSEQFSKGSSYAINPQTMLGDLAC